MFRHQLPVYSPLSLPALAQALVDAFAPGDILTALERVLARRSGAQAVRLYGSGTQALQRALAMARTRAASEGPIALPAFACYDVATAALGTGLPVVLYDIDPHTLGPDLDSLAAACAAGARVVVLVHLYGIPIDWDAVAGALAAHACILVEDAAQGQGAALRGRPLGSLGPLSVLSFGRGKGWTGGAGGALLLHAGTSADDAPRPPAPPVAAAARAYVASGMQWLFGRPALYRLPRAVPGSGLGETRFHPPAPERGMPALAAALVLRLERRADAEVEIRQAAGDTWAAELSGVPGVSLPVAPADARPGYLRFPLCLPQGVRSLPRAAQGLGIAPSYPTPLSMLAQLAPLRRDLSRRFPGDEELARTLFTLPTHSFVRPSDRAAILRLLRSGQRLTIPAAAGAARDRHE